MKKYIITLTFIVILIITGCELNNNPTSKVEELLGKYQGLDKEINYDYNSLSNNNAMTKEQTKKYKELIKKQYRNMNYEIKEETIDGDSATITTEVEVLDYKKVLEEKKNSSHEEIINELNRTKNKTTYTIDFTVTKDEKGKWHIDPLTEEQRLKLLGAY